MQFITLQEQLLSMLRALIFGAACALVYDGVRALRRFILPAGRGTVTLANVFDVIYGIFLGAAYSVFVFIANSGKNRWYLLFSCAVGFALYRLSAGRVISPVLQRAADILRKISGIVLKIISYPLKISEKLIKTAHRKAAARKRYKRIEKEKALRSKTSRAGRTKQERRM